MKKIIITLIAAFTLFTFTSCETYAQGVVYEDGVVYEYSYGNYPVRYVSGVPYYYIFIDNVWRWIVLPEIYRPHIVHHVHPMRYYHPRPHYNLYTYNRQTPRMYNHPNRSQTRHDIRGGNIRPHNPSVGHNKHIYRPNVPSRQSGGRFGGRGGGNFNHSSSRGGRR